MAFPSIATVNISLLTTAVSTANFGTPLFLSVNRKFVERVREYSSLTEVANDFAITEAPYKAAAQFFGQTPKPATFKVGRIAADAELAPISAVDGTDYGFYVAVNSNTVNLISYTAQPAEDQEDIIDELVAAFNITYDGMATATKVGTGATATLTIEPDTVNDNFVLGDMVNMTYTLASTETPSAALAACDTEDNNFYFVTSQYRSETEVLALAASVSASERMYFVGLAEQGALTPLTDSPTDIGGKLEGFGYDRVVGLFHESAATDYPELGYIGRFCTSEPGTIDWYAKTISGLGASKDPSTGKFLSGTLQNYILERSMNAIVKEGGVAVVKMGKTFSGQNIDTVWFRDFYAARLREGYQSWRINNNKIPYDQNGIDSAENVFRTVTERYVSTRERPHAIMSYRPHFPRRENVAFNDIANGVLKAAATVYLTGSILTVVLDGVLTFDAEF